MEDMIEKLYAIHLETETFPYGQPNKSEMDEEWGLYQFLYENLADKHKEAFLRYAQLTADRQERERKVVYEYGFKTGVKLFVQCLKD